MYALAQARYASEATDTASPARLLTMLYDRLTGDLAAAEAAMRCGDIALTGARLGRAQQILLELHGTLDVQAWPEGAPLADLYLWMVGELMRARLARDADQVASCLALVEPLRDAWHAASVAVGAEPAAGEGTAGAGGTA
jgi:flagellar protein FliS